MPMRHKGLAKLTEECGELQQVIGKLFQYPNLIDCTEIQHPDGTILRACLEDEIADVLAAIEFVHQKLKLNTAEMTHRRAVKLALFQKWDKEK